MKSSLSKSESQEEINSFFKKDAFSVDGVKKIKRLAMKYNIKLREHRKKFCKKCLNQLKGPIRITKTHKIIECEKCGYRNKFKLS